MQSKSATVDSYLKEVPEDRLRAMLRLRALFLTELKGYQETMRYGGPCYEKNNITEAGFMNQKNYIGLYILKQEVMNKYKDEFKGVTMGKGVIRFTNPDKIDFAVVKKMLKGTYESVNAICGHRVTGS